MLCKAAPSVRGEGRCTYGGLRNIYLASTQGPCVGRGAEKVGLSSIFSLAGTKNGSGYGPGHHRKKAAELIKSGSPGQSVGLRPKPGRGNEQLEELMVGGGEECVALLPSTSVPQGAVCLLR